MDTNIKAKKRLNLYESSYSISWIPDNANKCGFDEKKVQQYLAHLPSNLANPVKELLEHTEYISYSRMLHLLNIAIADLKRSIGIRPFAIVITEEAYSSENYILQLIWESIRDMNIIGIYNYMDDIPDVPIVWFDDAAYSGGNLSEMVSRVYEKTSEIHIVLCATHIPTMKGMLGEMVDKIHFHLGMKLVLPIDSIPNSDIIGKYYWTENTHPALYFDHKVASPLSTYRFLYLNAPIPIRELTEEEMSNDPIPAPGEQMGSLLCIDPSRDIIHKLEKYHQSLP